MSTIEKLKPYIVGGITSLLVFLIISYVGEIVLPFFFALILAFLYNPLVVRIQKRVKNRNVALTLSFLGILAIIAVIVVSSGKYLSRDAKRLVNAVTVFEEENSAEIQNIKDKAYNLLSNIPESKSIQTTVESQLDSLQTNANSEDFSSTLEGVYSFFTSSSEVEATSTKASWNYLSMFLSTIMYLVLILYSYKHFEDAHSKHVKGRSFLQGRLDGFWRDFKLVVFSYFRERLKIVAINCALLITLGLVLDLPGAIILAIVTGFFSIPSHFHYLSLPLYAISCWITSMESDLSFYLLFGIVLGVFALISILEETFYFDKILKSVNRMNPAILVLSYALWIYVFGIIIGTIIALPLTQLILLFGQRLLTQKEASEQIRN